MVDCAYLDRGRDNDSFEVVNTSVLVAHHNVNLLGNARSARMPQVDIIFERDFIQLWRSMEFYMPVLFIYARCNGIFHICGYHFLIHEPSSATY